MTNFSFFNAGGRVQPSAPPLPEHLTVTNQPQSQSQFLSIPEPGPAQRPTQLSSMDHNIHGYQPQSTTSTHGHNQPTFLPMPEPGPVYRPTYQPTSGVQPQQHPGRSYPPLEYTSQGDDAPPSYYESQLAQDPLNRFRTDIFKSKNRLNILKTQILERESRLTEFQRQSELFDGVSAINCELLNRFEQELTALQSCFRATQQHLKEIGENATLVSGTQRKKIKVHIQAGGCCETESHICRDLCDKKPKIHIEGMCNSPYVFAQTCEEQSKHTGWIWGKQKIQIDGMWVSPKVHLKGILLNPVIFVDGMWNKPEIHLEGICLNPEIHVKGMGVHPTIRITGLCYRLRVVTEGLCTGPRIRIVGFCDQIETSRNGCGGTSIWVQGVCKNLRRSLGTFSPSIKFKGNEMKIRV